MKAGTTRYRLICLVALIALVALGSAVWHTPAAAQCGPNDPGYPNCLPCEVTQSCTPVPPPQECGPNNPCTQEPPPNPTRRPTPVPTATPTATPSATASPSPTASPSQAPSATPTASATPVPTITPTPTRAGFSGWVSSIRDTIGGIFEGTGVLLAIPTRTPTPVPVDIEIVKIEITQGIQCLNNPDCPDNSVTLYEQRPTLIRAYVRLKSGPAFINNVSATLCQGSVWDRGCPGPVRPINPITVERAVADPVAFFRRNLKGTLNFIVPSDWITSPKSFFLSLNVNPKGEAAVETTYDNNADVQYFTFERRRRLDVVFVPFLSNGAISTYEDRWPIVGWLQLAYPTNNIHVWTTGYWLIKDYAFNDLSGGGCGRGWSPLLDDLEWFRGKYSQIYYGMVDVKSLQAGSPGGCGRYDAAFVSAGRSGLKDRRPGETAAQELGHNYERHHAPGFGAGSPDGGFPTSDGTIDEYGVDIVRMQLYRPGVDFDFMGYGGDESSKWTSLYTWRSLESQLPIAARPGAAHLASPGKAVVGESDFLVASGWLAPEAVTIDEGFFQLSLPSDSGDTQPTGPYALELVAADGRVLHSRALGPKFDSNADPSETGSFMLREPWIDGTTAVVVRYHDTVLARRALSAHAPVVKLLGPNGGEAWGAGSQTIQWEATDSDGDPLQTLVEYSLDDGRTWQPIGRTHEATSLTLDTSYLPGSSKARIRVLVSDGLRTSFDDSDASFLVLDKAPDVHITSIDEGQRVTQGAPLILLAAGSDPEDGPVDGKAFKWTSDRDGALGQGDFLTNSSLTVGEHALAVEAMDSQGQIGRYQVHIVVEPPPAVEPSAPAGPTTPPLIWVLIAAGAVLVVGAGVGVARRLRSRHAA